MAENTVRRYDDWAAGLAPVDATDIQNQGSRVARNQWSEFVTTAELGTIIGALNSGGIAFTLGFNPQYVVAPTEKRVAPTFTVGDKVFDANDILSVLWSRGIGKAGQLFLNPDGKTFGFLPTADPVAPPAPPPNVTQQLFPSQLVGFDQGKAIQEILFNLRNAPGWVRFQ